MSAQTKTFIGAVIAQVAMLSLIVAQHYTLFFFAHEIELRVRPYDPVSVLSGHYARLTYDIATPIDIPGVEKFQDLADGTDIYTVIVAGPDRISYAERMSLEYPTVHGNEHVIHGQKDGARVDYGINQRYIDENASSIVDDALRDPNSDTRAIVRLDKKGNASLRGLRIGNKVY